MRGSSVEVVLSGTEVWIFMVGFEPQKGRGKWVSSICCPIKFPLRSQFSSRRVLAERTFVSCALSAPPPPALAVAIPNECVGVSQSALKHSVHPLGSPVKSRSSSNDSWRQLIFEDSKNPPVSKAGDADDADGNPRLAVALGESGEAKGGGVGAEEEAATVGGIRMEDVEGMSVAELKLAAAEVIMVLLVALLLLLLCRLSLLVWRFRGVEV